MKRTKLAQCMAAAFIGASLSMSVFAASPLGSLQGVGATVMTDSGNIDLKGDYVYYGGDKISIGQSGDAKLRFNNDGAIEVGPESLASADMVDGKYIVNLEKGGLHFSFSRGVPFEIIASGQVIKFAEGPSAVADSGPVSGVVVINKEGKAVVRATSGALQVSDASGGSAYNVEAGQIAVVGNGHAELLKTVVEAPGTVVADADTIGWLGGMTVAQAAALGFVLVGTTWYIVDQNNNDNNNENPNNASPS